VHNLAVRSDPGTARGLAAVLGQAQPVCLLHHRIRREICGVIAALKERSAPEP
jgi:hypothetical protein